jgi:hypothetical protein
MLLALIACTTGPGSRFFHGPGAAFPSLSKNRRGVSLI